MIYIEIELNFHVSATILIIIIDQSFALFFDYWSQ